MNRKENMLKLFSTEELIMEIINRSEMDDITKVQVAYDDTYVEEYIPKREARAYLTFNLVKIKPDNAAELIEKYCDEYARKKFIAHRF